MSTPEITSHDALVARLTPTMGAERAEQVATARDALQVEMTAAVAEVDPRNAWDVAEIAHLTTGETIGDDGTGDEWSVARTNAHYPAARVITTYAVKRRPVGEDGNFLDTSEIPDEDAHPTWRYSVEDQTEFLATRTPADFWADVEWSDTTYGEGSYRDWETEEEADRACESMARQDAGLGRLAITWDGQPFLPGT